MDPRKHRRMEDEGTLITKSMKGSKYGLFPGIVWGLLAAEQMKFPGVIQTMKITGRKGIICAGTGGVFAGVEYLLEKYRMKRDIVNGVGGAFVAGAAFSGLRNGSIAMAITGGITFAITTVFIDGVLPENCRSQSGN